MQDSFERVGSFFTTEKLRDLQNTTKSPKIAQVREQIQLSFIDSVSKINSFFLIFKQFRASTEIGDTEKDVLNAFKNTLENNINRKYYTFNTKNNKKREEFIVSADSGERN